MSTIFTFNEVRLNEIPILDDELTVLKKKFPNPVLIEDIYDDLKKFNFKEDLRCKLKLLVTKDLNLIAKLAKTHDGYLFGGIVRDFFIREEDAKDVDIWFKNLNSLTSFKEELSNISFIKEVYKTQPERKEFSNNNYPFDRDLLHVTMKNTNLSYELDCIISPEFPDADFAVNEMIYDGEKVSHYSGLVRFDILQQIKEKFMIPNLNFYKKMKKDILAINRVSNFIRKGWTVVGLN